MKNIDDIFSLVGGSMAVAEICNVPLGTASAWKSRGSIPAEYWLPLVHWARNNRVKLTYDNLAEIAAERRTSIAGAA